MLRDAVEATDDPLIGLRVAERVQPGTFTVNRQVGVVRVFDEPLVGVGVAREKELRALPLLSHLGADDVPGATQRAVQEVGQALRSTAPSRVVFTPDLVALQNPPTT